MFWVDAIDRRFTDLQILKQNRWKGDKLENGTEQKYNFFTYIQALILFN
jgi:hypothetical protein